MVMAFVKTVVAKMQTCKLSVLYRICGLTTNKITEPKAHQQWTFIGKKKSKLLCSSHCYSNPPAPNGSKENSSIADTQNVAQSHDVLYVKDVCS